MSAFHDLYGFDRAEVGLHNWRLHPFSRFAFEHTREIVPTAHIDCGLERPESAPAGDGPLAGCMVTIGDAELGWKQFLEQSHCDVFVALKRGEIVAEWTAGHADAGRAHILFSISKSVTGILAGILNDQGLLDMEAPVSDYMPEANGSAFGTASIQQLADMRTCLSFDESYLNADGDYARYRRATGWNPAEPGRPSETMVEMLLSIRQGAGAHGGPFHYASPNTDLMGVVLERATGKDYCGLLSDLLWRPLGAHSHACMTVDAVGAPRGAGGMCATARDLARLAEAVRCGGEGANGRIMPAAWVDDMLHGGDQKAWQNGNFAAFLPNGRYRNCWYQTGYGSGAFCAIGIHGQWAYVDPTAETVLVRLSSQPIPLDDDLDQKNLSFFQQVCARLG